MTLDQLKYLLRLARKERRKRENDLAKMRPRNGQSRLDYLRIRQAKLSSIRWSRACEDALIQAVADIDPNELHPEHRDRFREIARAS